MQKLCWNFLVCNFFLWKRFSIKIIQIIGQFSMLFWKFILQFIIFGFRSETVLQLSLLDSTERSPIPMPKIKLFSFHSTSSSFQSDIGNSTKLYGRHVSAAVTYVSDHLVSIEYCISSNELRERSALLCFWTVHTKSFFLFPFHVRLVQFSSFRCWSHSNAMYHNAIDLIANKWKEPWN